MGPQRRVERLRYIPIVNLGGDYNVTDKKRQTTNVHQLRMLSFMKCALQILTSRLHVPKLSLPAFIPHRYTWTQVRISKNNSLSPPFLLHHTFMRCNESSTSPRAEMSIRRLFQEK